MGTLTLNESRALYILTICNIALIVFFSVIDRKSFAIVSVLSKFEQDK